MRAIRMVTIFVACILVSSFALFYLLFPREDGADRSDHEYFEEMPAHWTRISTGRFSDDIFDSYQCALRDDYYGTEELVTITNYHHGHVGIFVETDRNGTWERSPLCACFDPEDENGIPVKGIFKVNLDGDAPPEIITAADEVQYDTLLLNEMRWTGPVYIDLNEGNEPVVQILVWGEWGERITGTAPVMHPIPLDPGFRDPANLLPDIMLNLMPASGARLVILEQPPEGFGAVNYTFDGDGHPGVPPYEEEPFYVERLYESSNGSALISELVWKASEVEGANNVYLEGLPFDADGDALMDLVMAGTYFDSGEFIHS
ncbi:MAG: hypothetical protein L0Z54_04945, partial [Thermoplasmata archaeon]|nr:hypothetical protein [Thermoplasmata archaeon]